MGRTKKTEDPPKGAPAWMATFSDLMNLLLCFFVLLFSMSSVDAEKYAELVQSLSNGFGSFTIFSNKEADTLLDDELFPSSVVQAENIEEYEKDTGEPEEGMKKDEETGEVTGILENDDGTTWGTNNYSIFKNNTVFNNSTFFNFYVARKKRICNFTFNITSNSNHRIIYFCSFTNKLWWIWIITRINFPIFVE